MTNVLQKTGAALASGRFLRVVVRRALRALYRISRLPCGFLVEVSCLERPAHGLLYVGSGETSVQTWMQGDRGGRIRC